MRPLAVLLVSVSCALSVVPAAVGDQAASPKGHGQGSSTSPAVPSRQDVAQARRRAEAKAQDVTVIQTQMVLAGQRLDAATTQAEQASEAYNGALWRLSQAQQRYRTARADASRARHTVAAQRDRIGALVAQSYQQGGNLTALSAIMNADGPQSVLDQYAAYQGASTSLQADYRRFAATDSLAAVYQSRAAQARSVRTRLAGEARQARSRAAAAAAAAQGEASAVAAERTRLVRELASAQHTSAALARARQTALEEIARKRAEERARLAAAAAARARVRADAAAAARAEAARSRAAAAAAAAAKPVRSGHPGHGSGSGGSSSGGAGTPAPAPAPAPPLPAPAPAPAPAPSGGAQRAIGFAEAQLGEPYRWGAAGPGSWDCSGLTMGAWGAAGRSLPHYSVAQYASGTPIPVGEARPGDLYFWSSNGSPSGIHHVALALGGGRFIEAPHTGANVRYNSVYGWYPDFAVRL